MTNKIEFQGIRKSKDWNHFVWLVTINDESFEYKAGMGLATPKEKRDRNGYGLGWNKKPENSLSVNSDTWAHIPAIDDILQCLFLDADSGMESFDSFCDSCGYSSDSLSALDIYRACAENGKRLRKALGAEYETERRRIEALNL